ncbi:hypothetical protein CEXT_69231 [Caerostris extrusa]|uniref:Uncharacterized protein n=1 Tax=Caerostris extrusa TaxID=172846 RepID=A0AAV4TQ50_CAEEX|nr:hypothetical protein CEXT_69231 [Caerostris extrusa]
MSSRVNYINGGHHFDLCSVGIDRQQSAINSYLFAGEMAVVPESEMSGGWVNKIGYGGFVKHVRDSVSKIFYGCFCVFNCVDFS